MHGNWWGEAKTVDFSCYQMRGLGLKDCRETFSQPHKINKTGLAMMWKNKRGWLWLWLFNRVDEWWHLDPCPFLNVSHVQWLEKEVGPWIILLWPLLDTLPFLPIPPDAFDLQCNKNDIRTSAARNNSKPCKIKQPHNWEFVVMGLILCNAQNDDPLWNTKATQTSALSWANVLRGDVKVCAKKHQA